jgi:hypothetical protein
MLVIEVWNGLVPSSTRNSAELARSSETWQSGCVQERGAKYHGHRRTRLALARRESLKGIVPPLSGSGR